MLRFLTAGESHGQGLTITIDGFPAGVTINNAMINHHLARRQVGFGRGGRMKIETDQAKLLAGVRFGKSTGAPITMFIENRDWKNWETVMATQGEWTDEAEAKKFTRPRPGHADLAAYYKYEMDDLRDALERASARETAARVAAGAICRCLLEALDIDIISHVTSLGGIDIPKEEIPSDFSSLKTMTEPNDIRCAGSESTQEQIREHIRQAIKDGNTLGGEVEVIAKNVPPGLGSHIQWDRKLDGRLAQAVMSVQAVKAVSIGAGDQGGTLSGAAFHDEIVGQNSGQEVYRPTNRAGGLEAGITNGMPVVVRATMKPISTMRTPLRSINLESGKEELAHFERSDATAVPACGVVCEAMTAFVLAQATLEKFGSDNLNDIQQAFAHYKKRLKPIPVDALPVG